MIKLENYSEIYLKYLREIVIPFWEKNCIDREFGAYFTCFDRDGSVYDTEKFMWMQWRIVWMFAELYNKLEANPKWLEIAKNGYDFLYKNGRDENGYYYFSLNREGEPSMAPYNAFSDCFAVMGAAALAKASGDEAQKNEAIRAFEMYSSRENCPKGRWTKELSGKTAYKSLGFYMMKLNLFEVLRENLGLDYDKEIIETAEFVLDTFWNERMKVMFENVTLAKGFDLNSMAGRHTNPGHVLEAMWFIMNSARRLERKDIIDKSGEIILATLDYGWDKDFGGIFYFKDVLGKPHLELQHDMKLWWVHNEALIATFLAYKCTEGEEFANWFKTIHDWSWEKFPDKEFGEWFAYLDRQGIPNNMLKGGKWKTFFHLPRMLLNIGTNF